MKLDLECGDFQLTVFPSGRTHAINIYTYGVDVPDVYIDGNECVPKPEQAEEVSEDDAGRS